MPDLTIDPVAAAAAAVVAAHITETPAYAQRALRRGVRQDIFSEAGAILRAPVRYRRLAGWIGHAASSGSAAFVQSSAVIMEKAQRRRGALMAPVSPVSATGTPPRRE